jgi:hypothetical protein
VLHVDEGELCLLGQPGRPDKIFDQARDLIVGQQRPVVLDVDPTVNADYREG